MRWGEREMTTLARLAALGYSAERIAPAIGEGVTRHAVLGKAWRSGIRLRGDAAIAPIDRPRAGAAKPPRPEPPPPPPIAASRALGRAPVGLLDLESSHCRYPVEGGFCGQPRVGRAPYCGFHGPLCYVGAAAWADAKARAW